jgi:hypothetical protein
MRSDELGRIHRYSALRQGRSQARGDEVATDAWKAAALNCRELTVSQKMRWRPWAESNCRPTV